MRRRSRKTWTPEDDQQLVALHREGKSTALIAKLLDRSHEAVNQRLSGIKLRNDIKPQAGDTPRDEES
jgi:transposase-like protein